MANLSKSTLILAEQLQKQLSDTEFSKLSGKVLYQDDKTATYFVVAQIDKEKPKKSKKENTKTIGLYSWETLALILLWIAFLFLIGA
jgi:hypothetical protein